MTTRQTHVPHVEVDEARTLLAGDGEMVDVRDTHEWDAGHYPHAVHIPMDELPQAIGILPRTRRIIVASRSGRRASDAVIHLRAGGVDAVVLHGGLHAWLAAGGSLESTDGGAPRVV